jgi:ParB family chromosome partitioning protein
MKGERMMDETKRIPIGNIVITKDNPRQIFDEEPLRRLGESIRTHGLLQPIIVRPKEGYYELVVGERRLRAAQLAGMDEIEAKIEEIDDATCTELRLIENTHREDLTDAEKGDAVYVLIEKYPEKYR